MQAPIFRQIASALFMLSIIGLFFSKAILSVSLILFPILALLWILRGGKKLLLTEVAPFAALSLTFLIIVFSALKGGDTDYILTQLQMKLPFLALGFTRHQSAAVALGGVGVWRFCFVDRCLYPNLLPSEYGHCP